MGIEFSGLDDFARHLESETNRIAGEGATQLFAEEAARQARAAGLTTVDDMTLSLTVEGDPDGLITVDEAEVRGRANVILAGELDE